MSSVVWINFGSGSSRNRLLTGAHRMSADEFDPAIERLFAQTPAFPDSALFEADVAARLSKSSRVRSIALSLAGLMGGVIAVRELLNVDLNFGAGAASASAASAPTSDGGLALLGEGGYALQTLMDRSGLADLAARLLNQSAHIHICWTSGRTCPAIQAGEYWVREKFIYVQLPLGNRLDQMDSAAGRMLLMAGNFIGWTGFQAHSAMDTVSPFIFIWMIFWQIIA